MKSIFPFKQHAKWSIMSNKTMEVHGHVVHLCFFFLFHCCALKSFQYNDEKRGFSTSFIHLIPLGIKSTSVSQEATTRDAAVVVFLLRVCSVGWGTVIEKKESRNAWSIARLPGIISSGLSQTSSTLTCYIATVIGAFESCGKGCGSEKTGKKWFKEEKLKRQIGYT